MYRISCAAPTGSPGASHLVQTAASCRMFATSSALLQLQHKDRIYGSHGAGLVKHESMATKDLRNTFARNVVNAAPAADLFRSKVHEGLGTSDKDPYSRTLPNQESRAPESSVLRSAAVSAPSLEERLRLDRKWGTLQYWLGDQYPRLPVFVEQLLVTDAPPVSPAADRMVQSFAAEVIPRLASDAAAPNAQQKLEETWTRAVQAYGKLNTTHVFNKDAFLRELAALHASCVAEMTALTPREDGALALEVLRRKAVEKRNAFLKEDVLPLVKNSPYLGYGDAVWRIFFDSVNAHRAELFSSTVSPGHATLGFAWDALMMEDAVRTPAMTAPVALYLLLAAISESHTRAPPELRGASAHLDDGVGGDDVQRLPADSMRLVSPVAKRTFAEKAVRALLDQAQDCGRLAKALRAEGLYDWAREAALCEAMLDDQQLLQADVVDAVERFDSTAEVKSLLHSLLSGLDDAAKAHVRHVFQLTDGRNAGRNQPLIDWDAAMAAVDWTTRWRQHARALLSDPATLAATQKILKNAVGAKGATKRLFTQEYADELQGVLNRRSDRATVRNAKVGQLVRHLTSYQQVDRTLGVLRKAGVSLDELESAATAVERQQLVRRPQVDSGVLDLLLDAIRQRHPSWGSSGVLLPAAPAVAQANPALWYVECMARMYIRLCYVPQAAAASMAQRTRRRIGAVGLATTQFNVPAEMGVVEQYDNLQYKRYDWQGWYQRMVDVHNRNVSIRCRLDELKRLDAYGNPFVELQTERRLRILAGDRVGMGVLKLDSDKYEDQSDNITYGSTKVSELLADARKAQLGREYWPTVEVKVRRPSGQSKTYYSVLDDSRIEARSKELYEKYREAKKRSLFVTPMDMWLDVKGMQVRKTADTADAQGYTVDTLQDAMDEPARKE
ncbi:mitochondrial edited mRNA stability factor 1 subunit [Leptomonas pyrrhocoris]|uniref:Mitochondrial edited mRNA stability factor 1 subunit n=1 Tax=Leptomonas pyrrhocoris TaxID=157538 RepID=A0A0M9FPK1_LEPPY|nr:mitochondrial edited mRNA stability factor 1 subunit [Leptomonas pyrrhocoris]XP_015651905.1 mitochondrial edited mRNA stability factor 1 subunit [Leptomonas pyrrhocoris]XP_015651906.1 mitochondrial edited mRNA stability factor 1 subunit [Leptomonas pyrrhocoris]KPA73465.1 mitochondrial edited mRNA stability factor 1 subunit [Leptomonas pyrrhocoris]KPA73466.1 mitochondrial edited mRNA stability factor 1 subunit [Leptomonas pyrrhocoris]KPA73467.1 mitochondrial edited mRNA stability factor 1 su|eukprot:XP_015651904.1 mitochondrial edited mRNA stability factor 1 subunit [Leptomonas pyrrhocoris]